MKNNNPSLRKIRRVKPQLLHGWVALGNILGVDARTAKKYAKKHALPVIHLSNKHVIFYTHDLILALRQIK